MSWIFTTIGVGTIAFTATNLDDFVILMVFFAQVNSHFRKSHIYLGQYLGFAALIVCSLPGFLGGLVVPKPWIGLLGLVPIWFGIRSLIDRTDEEETQAVNLPRSSKRLGINPLILNVAAVTFANGGDNIGIYVPLFASQTWWSLGVILAVFFTLVGVWCAIADWCATRSSLAALLKRYGARLVPIGLIGLGIYILLENQTWKLVLN